MNVDDAVFGKLTLDERFKTWHGAIISNGRPLRLDIYAAEDGATNAAMRSAFAACQAKGFDYGHAAAAHLLDAYNRRWNEGAAIDTATFIDKLTLEQVTVENDGTLTLWYNDGDLFGGHAVFVQLDAAGTVQRVEIAG